MNEIIVKTTLSELIGASKEELIWVGIMST